MKFYKFAFFLLLLSLIIFAQAWLPFSINKKASQELEDDSPQNPKGSIQVTRKLYPYSKSSDPNERCVCGHDPSSKQNDWNVLLNISSSTNKTIRICNGVVIAHNLVLTSHKCLMLNKLKMYPYDASQPLPKHKVTNMVAAEDIEITTQNKQAFRVKHIIYNLDFGIYGAIGNIASGDDIAILVLDGDLFRITEVTDAAGQKYKQHFLTPVCLAQMNRKNKLSKNILHRYGYHNGFNESQTNQTIFVNNVVIFDGKECDENEGLADFSTSGALCIRTVSQLPKLEGGPLLTTNLNGGFIHPDHDGKGNIIPPTEPQISFLVGLSTVTQKQPIGKFISYTYFGNALKHIKYIEKIADQYNSSWCTTPPFVESKKADLENLKRAESIWQTYKAAPGSRLVDVDVEFSDSDLPEASKINRSAIPPCTTTGSVQGLGRNTRNLVARNGIIDQRFRWKVLRVELDDAFDSTERKILEKTLNWLKATFGRCFEVKIIPFKGSTYQDRVRVMKGKGCWATLGRQGGLQFLELDSWCVTRPTFLHELFHSLGVEHEQRRPDRDDYITIMWDNIAEVNRPVFQKLPANEFSTYGVPYNYHSIMHYQWYAFAIDPSLPTMVAKNGEMVGADEKIKLTDLQKIFYMYNCAV